MQCKAVSAAGRGAEGNSVGHVTAVAANDAGAGWAVGERLFRNSPKDSSQLAHQGSPIKRFVQPASAGLGMS